MTAAMRGISPVVASAIGHARRGWSVQQQRRDAPSPCSAPCCAPPAGFCCWRGGMLIIPPARLRRS